MAMTPQEVEAQMRSLVEADLGPKPPTVADFTEDELADMTPAERESILEMQAEAEDAAEPEQAEDDDAEPEAAAAAEAAKAPPPPEPAPEPVRIDFNPKIEAVTAEIKAKQDELAKLRTDWNDGEASDEAWDEGYARISADLATLHTRLGSIQGMSEAISAQTEAQEATSKAELDRQWEAASAKFAKTNPEFFTDTHLKGFDAEIQQVTANPAYAALPFETQIALAASRYSEAAKLLGIDPPAMGEAAPAPKAVETDRNGNKITNPKDAKQIEPPVTLRDVPSEATDPNESMLDQLARKFDMTEDPDIRDNILDQIERMGGRALVEKVMQYGG